MSDGFRIRDGSGLSYQDKLTAHAVLKILGAMARRPDFPVFRRSLAIAGVDGTLKDRMRGTAAAGNVRAKTGTLNAASSLSGYVTTANGHTLSFSMLMNGEPRARSTGRTPPRTPSPSSSPARRPEAAARERPSPPAPPASTLVRVTSACSRGTP